MIEKVPAWQVRRSGINHDWMKNSFHKAVGAFVDRLESDEPDEMRIRRFIDTELPSWNDYEPKIRKLIEDYENEMSPMIYFDMPPLNRCNPETKEWLRDVIHRLWLIRYDVKKVMSDAEAARKASDEKFCALKEGLKDIDSTDTEKLKEMLDDFKEFKILCENLSAALSVFQRKVMVV